LPHNSKKQDENLATEDEYYSQLGNETLNDPQRIQCDIQTPSDADDPNFHMPAAPPMDVVDSDSLLASYTFPRTAADVINISPQSSIEAAESLSPQLRTMRSPPGIFAAMTMSSTTALLASQLGRRWGNMQKVLDTTVSHDTPAFSFELTGEAQSVALCLVQGMENEETPVQSADGLKPKPEIVFLEKRLLPIGFHFLRLTKGEVTEGGTRGCESLEVYSSDFARNWEATIKLDGMEPGTYIVVPVTVNLHVARPFRLGVISLSDSLEIKPVSVVGLTVRKSDLPAPGAFFEDPSERHRKVSIRSDEEEAEEVEINTPFKDLLP
jgi:hypothetical protein